MRKCAIPTNAIITTESSPVQQVLYGGGPLVRFASLNEFIDALVSKKYGIFGGLDDLIDRNPAASTLNDLKGDGLKEIVDFWGALGDLSTHHIRCNFYRVQVLGVC